MRFFLSFYRDAVKAVIYRRGFFDPNCKETAVSESAVPALHFPNLARDELVEMRNTLVLHVKLPDYYEPYIIRSERCDNLGTRLRSKLLEIFDKTVFPNNGWFVDDGLKGSYLFELDEILDEVEEPSAPKTIEVNEYKGKYARKVYEMLP